MSMKSFEPVYDRLEEIIINDLPEEIEKVNKYFDTSGCTLLAWYRL